MGRRYIVQVADTALSTNLKNYIGKCWLKLFSNLLYFMSYQDFAALPWFLPYCFGADPPSEATNITECRKVTKDNVNDIIAKYKVPYTHVKALVGSISNEMKGKLAREEAKLDTLLW